MNTVPVGFFSVDDLFCHSGAAETLVQGKEESPVLIVTQSTGKTAIFLVLRVIRSLHKALAPF